MRINNRIAILLAFLMLVTFSVEAFAVSIDNEMKSFEDKIIEVKVEKRLGGKWIEAMGFEDGEEVRIAIKYEIKDEELTPRIYYNLPGGIHISKEQVGIVFNGLEDVGEYVINKDGRIEIEFTKEFLESDGSLRGNINFNAKVFINETSNKGEVIFPGNSNIIVIEENINKDIKIDKRGKRLKDKIKYTIVVSTENGTPAEVNIEDYINKYNTYGVEYEYKPGSFSVYKNNEKIRPEINFWENRFKIENLPKLKAGEKYVITYNLGYSEKNMDFKENSQFSIHNNVITTSGKLKNEDNSSHRWEKNIVKTGRYNPITKVVDWKIIINKGNRNIEGWRFQDRIPGELVGRVYLNNKKDITPEGRLIDYIFSKEDQNKIQIITYSTRVPDGKTQVENLGQLWTENGEYIEDKAVVNIKYVEREASLYKGVKSQGVVEGNKLQVNWYLTYILPEGNLSEIVIEDRILSKNHYAIKSELEEDFKKSLALRVSNEEIYRYGEENDKVDISIEYFGKKNRINHFKIIVTPKQPLKGMALTIEEYTTYADFGKSREVRVQNEVKSGELEDIVETEYKKEDLINKKTRLKNGKYKSGFGTIRYENTNGKLEYKVELKQMHLFHGKDVEVVDTLPQNTKFVEGSLRIKGEKAEHWIEDGRLYIKIENFQYRGENYQLDIYYQLDVSDDDWEDGINLYKNTVEFSGETSSTNTKVVKDIKKLGKKGEQIKEAGKFTNRIKYEVIINPKAEDLAADRDTLELIDTLKAERVEPNLDRDSLKLYRINGELVSKEEYKVKYDEKNKEIYITIPDEKAYRLEYVYTVNPNFTGKINVSNKANLHNICEKEDEILLRELESSATVEKKVIKMYKVDEDNFNRILPGTEFRLEEWNGKRWEIRDENLIVNEEGYLGWDLLKNELKKDTLYNLVETKALDGYSIKNKNNYFIWGRYKTCNINSRVPKEKIRFFEERGGISYITNKYTKICINKIWKGSKLEKIKATIYRHKAEEDGYEVGFTVNNTRHTVKVKKNSKKGCKIVLRGWISDGICTSDDGEIIAYINKHSSETTEIIIPEVKGDMEIFLDHKGQHPRNVKFVEYDKPDMVLMEKEAVETFELSEENNWQKIYENLEGGYYYTVEEEPLAGYETAYTNNMGIQNGNINIINTKKQELVLPQTGGHVSRARILGFILMIVSLFYFLQK